VSYTRVSRATGSNRAEEAVRRAVREEGWPLVQERLGYPSHRRTRMQVILHRCLPNRLTSCSGLTVILLYVFNPPVTQTANKGDLTVDKQDWRKVLGVTIFVFLLVRFQLFQT
jgi:hypothetical protein